MSNTDNFDIETELNRMLENSEVTEREKQNLVKIHEHLVEVRKLIVDNMIPDDLETPPAPGPVEAKLMLFFLNEGNMAFNAIARKVQERWPELEQAVEKVEQRQEALDPFDALINGNKNHDLNESVILIWK